MKKNIDYPPRGKKGWELPWNFIILIISILFFALLFASSSYAFVNMKSEGGANLRWREMPIFYWIEEHGTEDIPDDIEFNVVHKSFSTWEKIPDVEIDFEYMGTSTVRGGEELKVNLISWKEEGWDEDKNLISYTKVWYNAENGEILGFDIELNGENYIWTNTDDPDDIETDLENTLAHEIGHVLGLGHPMDIPEATMYPTARKGEIEKRDLFYDDVDGARFLYGVTKGSEGGCGMNISHYSVRRVEQFSLLYMFFTLLTILLTKKSSFNSSNVHSDRRVSKKDKSLSPAKGSSK